MSDISSLLVAPVNNGKTKDTSVSTTSAEAQTRGTSNLGKDSFMQLLVAEMKNQDPLEPTTNTEWISQLATFSQLEELQSMSKTTETTQIFSLIGKQVMIKTTDANGKTYLKSGTVDFVSTQGGETKYSVNGNLYDMSNLYSVIDSSYYYEQNRPFVTKEVELTFNGDDPSDLQFEVNLGNDVAQAKNVALMVGDTVLNPNYVYLSGTTVTISRDILNQFEAGSYNIDVVFDDANYTTVYGAVKINVFNPHPIEPDNRTVEEDDIEDNIV